MMINVVMGVAVVFGARRVSRGMTFLLLIVLHALSCLTWGLSWFNVETSVYTLCIYLAIYGLSGRVRYPLVSATLGGTALFFVLSNAAAWWQMSSLPIAAYPRDLGGLWAAYLAGLPFLLSTTVKNVVGVAAVAGMYRLCLWGMRAGRSSVPNAGVKQQISSGAGI
ncbi:MAG: hypothetical protein LBS64_01605 [Spirochaetaceae bacterium]|nr:hypothetical protein [Spirochaetaceae bacterium]